MKYPVPEKISEQKQDTSQFMVVPGMHVKLSQKTSNSISTLKNHPFTTFAIVGIGVLIGIMAYRFIQSKKDNK